MYVWSSVWCQVSHLARSRRPFVRSSIWAMSRYLSRTEYYTDIIPLYKTMIEGARAKFVVNDSGWEIDARDAKERQMCWSCSRRSIRICRRISQNRRKRQRSTTGPSRQIAAFLRGWSEARRLKLQEYGSHDITRPFRNRIWSGCWRTSGQLRCCHLKNDIQWSSGDSIQWCTTNQRRHSCQCLYEQGTFMLLYVKLKNAETLCRFPTHDGRPTEGYTDGRANVNANTTMVGKRQSSVYEWTDRLGIEEIAFTP